MNFCRNHIARTVQLLFMAQPVSSISVAACQSDSASEKTLLTTEKIPFSKIFIPRRGNMKTHREFDSNRRNLMNAVAGSGVLLAAGTMSQSSLAQENISENAQRQNLKEATRQTGYVTYTRDNCCLLMIDYQSGIMNIAPSQPPQQVVANAVTLLAAARVLGIPVIFTSSEETKERKGKFVAELTGIVPEAYEKRIKRRGVVDAFGDAAFAAAVRTTGRNNLVLGGISTEECISVPALTALKLGYNVKVIADACSSHSPFTDDIQFNRMRHYGIDVTTTRQFAADMIVDWSQKEAAEIYRLAAAHQKG